MATILGIGAHIAPELNKPVASLSAGEQTITIEHVSGENDGLFQQDDQGNLVLDKNKAPIPAKSGRFMVKCVYPDGFAKNHQVTTPQDLAAQVLPVLRFRYGATECNITRLPDSLTAGSTLTVEV